MKPALVADGLRLEAEWHGPSPAEAPTLVLLHEGLGCVATWKDFPRALAERTGCGVLAYSRAGYGRSDPVPLPRPLDYMHREANVVLPAVLDQAGIRQAILVGHSDGASIATIFAGGREDPRVCGLVLMAPHFFVEDVGLENIAVAKAAYERGVLRARLARYHGDNVDVAFWGWNRAWLDPDFRGWRIDDALARVRVPILVMQGRDDQYGTAAQVEMAEDKACGPVETLWLDHCGHSPHADQPQATLEGIETFARRVLVPGDERARAG